ncbi:hypothetical protein ACFY30_30210 [Streptomyces sp. NPDC000345]|uniref:hypothetical protein n=1 Tax=Streptomyces sp. NPDC000345 TaxID=3364537 RepID=UPI0036746F95
MPLGAALFSAPAPWLGMRTAFAPFAVAAPATIVPFLKTATPAALAATGSPGTTA